MFSYKNPVEPPVYLWSFIVRDSVLDMTTEVEGGRVSAYHNYYVCSHNKNAELL